MLETVKAFIGTQIGRDTGAQVKPRLYVPPGGGIILTHAARTEVSDYVGGLSVAYLEHLLVQELDLIELAPRSVEGLWAGHLTLDENAVMLYGKHILHGASPFSALEATSVSLLHLGGVRQ